MADLEPIAINLGRVKPGDVVLVHGDPGVEFLNELVAQLVAKCGHRDFVLVAMESSMGLDIVDEAAMRHYGWMRIPRVP